MSTILHIETSTNVCSVAVSEDAQVIFQQDDHSGLGHAEKLGTMVDEALSFTDNHAIPFDAVAVSCGPGSYTGLRIGVSMAKGICYGRNLKLIAVPTLDILNDEAKKILATIRKKNPFGEYMFMKNGERILSRCFTLRLLRLCKKLGIPPRSMHKIRKTYATKLINGGVDERLIIKQMGHTNINCTRDYYYYSDKTFEEAQAQIKKALSS